MTFCKRIDVTHYKLESTGYSALLLPPRLMQHAVGGHIDTQTRDAKRHNLPKLSGGERNKKHIYFTVS